MRIALVAPLISPIAPPYLGGAQALLADLAAGLAARGHQITLFAASGSSIPDSGVSVRDVGIDSGQLRPAQFHEAATASASHNGSPDPSFFRSVDAFRRVFTLLQQELSAYDLIHAHAFDWPAFAFGALLATRLPVIHTLHLPAVDPKINALLRDLRASGNPTRLVTVSQACADGYRPYADMDAIISNGIDTDAIPFGPVADADGSVLFAGRLSPEKGVTDAIEIARRAGRHLSLAGGIYDTAYFERAIQPQLHARKHDLEYVGLVSRPDLWSLMGRATAVLLPIAWEEPFGLVAAEAMAAGCPVIAYARGALPEVVSNGETGFLIPPGDVDAAAQAIVDAPSLSRAACRERAQHYFSIAHMLDNYEQFYEQWLHS
ncbi:MAG TPA: glycosyltransferase [Ktedonobacterales bacterium]|jgi:glycosyltransferase involved in cell wall biosynthesis